MTAPATGGDKLEIERNRYNAEKACRMNGHDANVTVVCGVPVLVVCFRCGKTWDIVETP